VPGKVLNPLEVPETKEIGGKWGGGGKLNSRSREVSRKSRGARISGGGWGEGDTRVRRSRREKRGKRLRGEGGGGGGYNELTAQEQLGACSRWKRVRRITG